jgi:EAL domain-containing protein (putative c-di-GMP-specific phosphodiesterase class I)
MVQPELLISEANVNSWLDTTLYQDPFVVDGRELRVTCRSGIARAAIDAHDADTLLQKAEAALKRAKETGEAYLHYRLEMHSEIAERLALEHRLRVAIDARQFELHYQPQVRIASGRIEAVEALLRWNDPEQGLVSPARFLPLLESSGLIVAVGRWVLDRVVEDCQRWASMGLGPLRVAVNVSALELRRRTFVSQVLEAVKRLPRGEPHFELELEITETALLQDVEGTSRRLRELRAAGVRIALDDFGTGYSSLGLLSQLPVDVLKIDRSFVEGLPGDAASVTLARTIIGLGSAFGLMTVGEGVESATQEAVLKDLRCDYAQGFLHFRPLPAPALERVLPRTPR